MPRLWTPIDPYFWQALGEEVVPRLRGFCRAKPLVAVPALACAAFVVLALLSALAARLPRISFSSTTDISGMLRVDGSPVSEGVIQFLPKWNGQATIAMIRDGGFKAQGVVVGPYRVVCFATRETGKKTRSEGGDSFPERVSVIPETYRDGIELKILAGQKELVLDWNSK